MLLRRWLNETGVTQDELARRAGCTVTMVNYLVNGKKTDVRISLLRRLAEATGLPAAELVDDLLKVRDERVHASRA